MRLLYAISVFTAVVSIFGCASVTGKDAKPQAQTAQANKSQVEEIFVVRSIRTKRFAVGKSTDFCNATTLGTANVASDDYYTFSSITTDRSTGEITDADAKVVGYIHACFSTIVNGALTMIGEGELGGVKFTGPGECTILPAVEPGATPARCWFNMTASGKGYTRALLTTNSLFSRNAMGNVTDPPGYTQSSIAVVRIWRPR